VVKQFIPFVVGILDSLTTRCPVSGHARTVLGSFRTGDAMPAKYFVNFGDARIAGRLTEDSLQEFLASFGASNVRFYDNKPFTAHVDFPDQAAVDAAKEALDAQVEWYGFTLVRCLK
jgi:hypothetical protein